MFGARSKCLGDKDPTGWLYGWSIKSKRGLDVDGMQDIGDAECGGLVPTQALPFTTPRRQAGPGVYFRQAEGVNIRRQAEGASQAEKRMNCY